MNLCQYQQFDKQSDETLIIEREFNFLWEMATPIYVTYISYYSWFLGIIIETKPNCWFYVGSYQDNVQYVLFL